MNYEEQFKALIRLVRELRTTIFNDTKKLYGQKWETEEDTARREAINSKRKKVWDEETEALIRKALE